MVVSIHVSIAKFNRQIVVLHVVALRGFVECKVVRMRWVGDSIQVLEFIELFLVEKGIEYKSLLLSPLIDLTSRLQEHSILRPQATSQVLHLVRTSWICDILEDILSSARSRLKMTRKMFTILCLLFLPVGAPLKAELNAKNATASLSEIFAAINEEDLDLWDRTVTSDGAMLKMANGVGKMVGDARFGFRFQHTIDEVAEAVVLIQQYKDLTTKSARAEYQMQMAEIVFELATADHISATEKIEFFDALTSEFPMFCRVFNGGIEVAESYANIQPLITEVSHKVSVAFLKILRKTMAAHLKSSAFAKADSELHDILSSFNSQELEEFTRLSAALLQKVNPDDIDPERLAMEFKSGLQRGLNL